MIHIFYFSYFSENNPNNITPKIYLFRRKNMSNLYNEKIDTEPLVARELYVSGECVDLAKIPGEHASYFLDQMRLVFSGLGWELGKGVSVRKLKGDSFHPIIFSKEDHQLTVKLNPDMSKVIVALDGKRHIELPVRLENGKILLYKINRLRPPDAFLPEYKVNRLLYWGDLMLFDYIADPLPYNSDEKELVRNITLNVRVGKLVKKFEGCKTKVPYLFRRILLNKYVADKYKGKHNNEMVEDTSEWVVHKHTSESYYAELKDCNELEIETLMKAYQIYLDSPLCSDDFQNSDMAFKFTPEGTDYEISVLFNGKIKRIKVVPPNNRPPTAEEIIEMSEWANRELFDIVEKAAICKKIEETYEPDTDTEIKEVCGL
jgi:hypothetical protein